MKETHSHHSNDTVQHPPYHCATKEIQCKTERDSAWPSMSHKVWERNFIHKMPIVCGQDRWCHAIRPPILVCSVLNYLSCRYFFFSWTECAVTSRYRHDADVCHAQIPPWCPLIREKTLFVVFSFVFEKCLPNVEIPYFYLRVVTARVPYLDIMPSVTQNLHLNDIL